jgi:protoporphyrinogen/coproporphyrinogen III oxidase
MAVNVPRRDRASAAQAEDAATALDVASLAKRGMEMPSTRVVVIGGGVGGLVAARDCLHPGFDVTLIEASDVLGGCVASHDVASIRLDSGAESFATRGGHVAKLIDELGLSADVVSPNPAGAWVRLPNATVPLPKAGLLGIPSSPLAADVVRVIGWSGALRAYLDRLAPVLKIGQERSLGVLVRKRMGRKVLERLVSPIASGVYSAPADDLDIAVVAPGLNAALTRQGSLSGAVADLRSSAKAGSAVGGIDGGMFRLIEALAEAVVSGGGTIVTGVSVGSVLPAAGGLTTDSVVELSTDDEYESIAENETEFVLDETGDEQARPAVWLVQLDDGRTIEADAVILATPGPIALDLMRDAAPELAPLSDLDWPEASSVELATLILDAPQLAAHPRGTGVLVAEDAGGGVAAKALTHATAKWAWLAERAGSDRHILRLSYGRAGQPSATLDLDDDAFRELARRDAATLLNMPLDASAVVGFSRTRWTNALPFASVGERDRIGEVRERINDVSGIDVTGAWLTGTGLASVIPDAREAAHRVRGLRWKALTENL